MKEKDDRIVQCPECGKRMKIRRGRNITVYCVCRAVFKAPQRYRRYAEKRREEAQKKAKLVVS